MCRSLSTTRSGATSRSSLTLRARSWPSSPSSPAARRWWTRTRSGPSNEAVRVLRAHLVRRREEKLRRRWRALPRPLFCSTTGGYPDPSGVRQAFRHVCVKAEKKAGLTRDQAGADGLLHLVARFTPPRPPPHLRGPPPPGGEGRLLRLPDARARRHLADRPHLRRLAPAAPPDGPRRRRRRRGRDAACKRRKQAAPRRGDGGCSPRLLAPGS